MKTPTKICLITDEKYTVPTAVTVSSLICNMDNDSFYDIYIITYNVSDFSKEMFMKFENKHVSINFFEINENKFKNLKVYSHVPTTALLKFQIPDIFKEFEKILYIDGDIIVQKDLSELYNTALDNNYTAAVIDMVGEYSKNLQDIVGVDNYFNSGVMLLNLKQLRMDNIFEKLIDAKINHPYWTSMDQDPLNFVFNKKVLLLEPKYNATIAAFDEFKYDIATVNKFYNTNYKCMEELQADTVINHLAGCSRTRPWEYIDGTFSEQWTYYYLQSPFKHIELKRKVYNALLYPKLRPFLKNLFSVTNGKGCKILCILGIRIKFKK